MIEGITRYGWRRLTGPAALFALLSGSLFSFALAEGEDQESDRPYFNRKAVPENIRDLLKIQEALQSSLPRTRKATVGIDMGGGAGSGVIVSEDGIVLTAAHVSGGVGKEGRSEEGRRLNSSHVVNSYAVFGVKKKNHHRY